VYEVLVMLHVLGATIWTGGHLVLVSSFLPSALRTRDPRAILAFESRYERVGMPALAVQVVTGLVLAHHILPDVSLWFSLSAGAPRQIAVKLILLAATIVLAVDARLRIIPTLGASNLVNMMLHIGAVTVLSVLFVLVGVGIRFGGLF
jgi:putative copper export protein